MGGNNTSTNTMQEFCKSIGWESGKNADDCQNKYYITSCIQPGGVSKSISKLKISTADIPLADVNAVVDLMHKAIEEKWNAEPVKEDKDMIMIGEMIEELKQENVSRVGHGEPRRSQ
jgi:hypothetical protein